MSLSSPILSVMLAIVAGGAMEDSISGLLIRLEHFGPIEFDSEFAIMSLNF